MPLMPAAVDQPSFFSVSVSGNKDRTNHYVVAWLVSENGDTPTPVLYPAVPKGNVLFYEQGMSIVINAKTGEKFGSADSAYAQLVKK